MKVKNNWLDRLIVVLITILISLGVYIVFEYNVRCFNIENGFIVIQTNWLPIIIHIIISLAIIVVLQCFLRSFLGIVYPIAEKLLKDLKDAFIEPIIKLISNIKLLIPGIRLTSKQILLTLLIFAVALIQTYTLWDFWGERVDENALYPFAIGFFGGDFDPNWYGYGSLGMYLLYVVYVILAIPPLVVGKFASMDEYAMQMFCNGYFVLVARYVFAVIGVITVMVYAKLARQLKIPIVLILIFAVLSFLSKDAIHFANYLRTDQLVGLFVGLSVFFAYKSEKKVYLYLLAIAVAGAISSKVSAFPLVLILGGYSLFRLYDKTIKWPHIIGVALTFMVFIHIFQPYVNYTDRFLSIINLGAEGRGGGETAGSFNWGKAYHYSAIYRFQAIYNIFIEYCTLPIIISLFFLVFSKKYLKAIIPSLATLLLLIIPYINSPEITYYWFLPAFNLVRFLSLLAVAGFVSQAVSLLQRSKFIKPETIKIGTLSAMIVFVFFYLIMPSLQNYFQKYRWLETNKSISQKWIERNLLEYEFILIEGNVKYNLPELYDLERVDESRRISNLFVHKNSYLNRIFREFLEEHYYQLIDAEKSKGVKQIFKIDVSDEVQVNNIIGKYYITSPATYNRYLNRSTKDLSPARKKQLMDYQAYYRYMISNPLYKRFDSGRGQPVEIYHITRTFSNYHDTIGYNFENQYAEVDINQPGLLTGDLTISINIKLNRYPDKWTPIIGKFKSDYKNEFSLRLRSQESGQWYFGVGDNAIVSNWVPKKVLPVGEWVNLTAVRDMSKGELKLFVNGEEFISRLIQKNMKAIDTDSPIRIMGYPGRPVDGQLGDVHVWSKSMTPSQLKSFDIEKGEIMQGLVGFWKFDDAQNGVVRDLSGNNFHVLIKK